MKNFDEKINFLKQHKKIKIATICVACLALFLSFYFLILPAITMEAEPICGDPEHLHTQECFEEEVEINFICGLEEHEHTADCYDEEGNLTCLRQEHKHNGHCIQALIIKDSDTFVEELIHGDIDKDEVELPEGTSDLYNKESKENIEEIEEIEETEDKLEEDKLEEDEEEVNEDEEKSEDEELDDNLEMLSSRKLLRSTRASSSPFDFTDWITDIRLQVAHDGQNFIEYHTDEPLYSYQTIKFAIEYTIPANTLSVDNRTIQYQLPYNLTILERSEGKVFSKSGNIIGDYIIEESGVITIIFFEEFAQKNARGEVIFGDIMFNSDVKDWELKKDGSVEFIFRDDIKIEINVTDKSNKQGDLYVEKSQSQLDSDGFINYTIRIYTNEGTGDEITIEDKMSNVLYYDNFEIKDNNGRSVYVPRPNRDTNSFTYTLPRLYTGGYYLITYKAKLADDFTSSTYLNNQIHAESKDSEGYEIEATTSVSMYYSVNIISKTGIITDDGFIEWEIDINKDNVDIGGYTIIDTFNNIPFEEEVQLIGPYGTQTIRLPYTFPAHDTNTYKIRYRTNKEKIYGGNSAFNKVTLKKDDKTYDSEKYIYIGESAQNVLEKTGKDIQVDENNYATLTWNLNFEIYDPVPAGQEFSDFTSGNHYFTAAQVREFLSQIDRVGVRYEYKLYGENGWWPEYESIQESAKYGSIRIKFLEPLRSGTIINFDYHTTAYITDINKSVEYTNKFSVGNNTTETHIDFEPEVRKYDPTASGDPTRHVLTEDGLITWNIDFTVPEVEFDIKEIIPEGTNIESIKLNGENLQYTTDEDGAIWIHFNQDFATSHFKSKQTIEVSVKIAEDFDFERHSAAISTGTFKNAIDFIVNNENVSHSEHTQIIEKHANEEEIKIITKKYNGVQHTDTLPYTLDINEKAKDFSEDDFLTVVDDMTYNGNSDYVLLYIMPDSIEAFEVTESGSTRKLTDEEFSYKYTYDISEASGKWGECSNKIEFKIPDGMHVRIDYMYKINGKADKNQWYAFKNSATVTNTKHETEGYYTNISVSISESAATAYTEGIELHKVDEDTGKPLENVYFRLYKYNGSTYELVTVNDNDIYKTNEKGLITFKDMALNTAYYLEEVLQPENYLKLDNYYFLIHDDNIKDYPVCKPDDFDGITYRRGMNITLSNKKPVTKVKIKKRWTDGNGIEDGEKGDSAKINLYQSTQSDEAYNNGINTDGVVGLNYSIGPNEWATWDTGSAEYIVGSVLRLSIRCTNKDYVPDNIVVKLNGETIGGAQNASYLEIQHDGWTENARQYTDYTYDFTINKESELDVKLNYYSQGDITYNIEAISVPSQPSNGMGEISDIPYKTVILNEANNWEYEWTDLPTVGIDEDGNVVHYFYSIKESEVPGYLCEIECVDKSELSYEYVVTNKRTPPPSNSLPATGGIGVYPLYLIGVLFIGFALYEAYRKKKK